MSFSGELRGIAKSFGVVRANQDVNFMVRAGTIHALVGENGAGKSTSMKILFGMVKPDAGAVLYGGKNVPAHWNPEIAFAHGVGMVHQHFMLAGLELVHDNLVLGSELSRFGVRSHRREREVLEHLMASTGLRVPLDKKIEDLPIGLQSRCEILKVLYRKANFLILDEPTAVLTPQETDDFLVILKRLRDQGKTILIVTHKLREVMAVSDDVTVLRAGRTVASRKTSETSIADLSELMVGRRLQLPKVTRNVACEALPVEVDLSLGGGKLTLKLRAGEITGIAGVEGNGQDELVEALTDPGARGDIDGLRILGHDGQRFSTKDVRGFPVAVIPADRHHDGLVLDFTLTENLRLGRKQVGKSGLRRFSGATADEQGLLKAFDVRPANSELPARALSGGNQQKLIVARELGELPKRSLVLAVHPTRGVDLGAIEFIHGRILEAARNGAAILLISSELDEVMALSHRVGVLYRGAITEWFEGPPYNEAEIGYAMLSGNSKRAKEEGE